VPAEQVLSPQSVVLSPRELQIDLPLMPVQRPDPASFDTFMSRQKSSQSRRQPQQLSTREEFIRLKSTAKPSPLSKTKQPPKTAAKTQRVVPTRPKTPEIGVHSLPTQIMSPRRPRTRGVVASDTPKAETSWSNPVQPKPPMTASIHTRRASISTPTHQQPVFYPPTAITDTGITPKPEGLFRYLPRHPDPPPPAEHKLKSADIAPPDAEYTPPEHPPVPPVALNSVHVGVLPHEMAGHTSSNLSLSHLVSENYRLRHRIKRLAEGVTAMQRAALTAMVAHNATVDRVVVPRKALEALALSSDATWCHDFVQHDVMRMLFEFQQELKKIQSLRRRVAWKAHVEAMLLLHRAAQAQVTAKDSSGSSHLADWLRHRSQQVLRSAVMQREYLTKRARETEAIARAVVGVMVFSATSVAAASQSTKPVTLLTTQWLAIPEPLDSVESSTAKFDHTRRPRRHLSTPIEVTGEKPPELLAQPADALAFNASSESLAAATSLFTADAIREAANAVAPLAAERAIVAITARWRPPQTPLQVRAQADLIRDRLLAAASVLRTSGFTAKAISQAADEWNESKKLKADPLGAGWGRLALREREEALLSLLVFALTGDVADHSKPFYLL
jgi:hypothetical protein